MEQFVYIFDGFWRKHGDPELHRLYPFMSGGPLPVLLIVAVYLCLVRVIGPRFMESRKPYDLKGIIRVYNVMVSFLNAYMFYRATMLTKYGLDYFRCNASEELEMVTIGLIYFISKIVELLDTVFFVLRKRYKQSSNLYVFHHSFMVICSWLFIKLVPNGGATILFPYLNVLVHSVLYAYYFLATFKSMHKYLWWKRHITTAEMVKFVLSMIHFAYQGLTCYQYSGVMLMFGFIFNLIFLVLFCSFYHHKYLKPNTEQCKTLPA